jgi:hypothetical protein
MLSGVPLSTGASLQAPARGMERDKKGQRARETAERERETERKTGMRANVNHLPSYVTSY